MIDSSNDPNTLTASLERKTSIENNPRFETRQNSFRSLTPRAFARNMVNDEWSERVSTVNQCEDESQTQINSLQNSVLDKEVKTVKAPNFSQEKNIKYALEQYFEFLQERLINGEYEDKKFSDAVKEYIIENSREQDAQVLQETDNLLWKSLKLVDQLSKKSQKKTEKLKMYISVLATQLNIQSQKYCETKYNISRSTKEKKYLELRDNTTFELKNEWLQINKALDESKITLHINSARKLKWNSSLPSWYCVVKADETEHGRTIVAPKTLGPNWSDMVSIPLSKEKLFENIIIEVYECSSEPVLFGECYITLQEMIENTLFYKNFSLNLPIVPAAKVDSYLHGSLMREGSTHDVESRTERLSCMNEQEFTEYMQSALLGGDNLGFLNVTFEVELDPSFRDIVQDVRAQRLENLTVWAEEGLLHLDEQLDYLKFSIAPIHTLEVDPNTGIRPKSEVRDLKKRGKMVCGVCSDSNCNLF